jgi:hypothetical protein
MLDAQAWFEIASGRVNQKEELSAKQSPNDPEHCLIMPVSQSSRMVCKCSQCVCPMARKYSQNTRYAGVD